MCIYVYIYTYIYTRSPRQPPGRSPRFALGGLGSVLSVKTGKRKRVTRKADGKLTLLVNLGGSWHEKLTLLVTHFSLPIALAYPFQGH